MKNRNNGVSRAASRICINGCGTRDNARCASRATAARRCAALAWRAARAFCAGAHKRAAGACGAAAALVAANDSVLVCARGVATASNRQKLNGARRRLISVQTLAPRTRYVRWLRRLAAASFTTPRQHRRRHASIITPAAVYSLRILFYAAGLRVFRSNYAGILPSWRAAAPRRPLRTGNITAADDAACDHRISATPSLRMFCVRF